MLCEGQAQAQAHAQAQAQAQAQEALSATSEIMGSLLYTRMHARRTHAPPKPTRTQKII